jgi:Na+-transporting methylmalonyl-CoA/oxaloacetate decarboxylase gamma subunit
MMKNILVLVCLLLLTTTALAQTRSRSTKRAAPAPKASEQQAIADAKTAGATKVAEQIKNLTRFVYLLGGVAKGIEQVDEAAKKNEASPTALQQNEQNKTTVKNSLRNVREGLDQLEIYFRATPGLLDSYLKLAGSASGAATAEEQAAAGHFDQAGRTMLGVINRLTDVLVVTR